jgi:hypothetical protein
VGSGMFDLSPPKVLAILVGHTEADFLAGNCSNKRK